MSLPPNSREMITEQQKEYLLPEACNAALRAGAAILEIYESGEPVDVAVKSDSKPITIADRRAHGVIREYLSRTRIPLLSEEGREMLFAERKDWDLFWMVDPLDGTVEFIKGNGEFTVNIALMADNRPVFGVIYVPYRKLLYFSDGDRGSFRITGIAADAGAAMTYADLAGRGDVLPIAEQRNKPLRIAVSRSHRNAATDALISEVAADHPAAVQIEQGSSYKLCLVAEGAVDYYPRTSDTSEWDTAAGEAILRGAGGEIYSLADGKRLEYNKESLFNPYFACRSRWFRRLG